MVGVRVLLRFLRIPGFACSNVACGLGGMCAVCEVKVQCNQKVNGRIQGGVQGVLQCGSRHLVMVVNWGGAMGLDDSKEPVAANSAGTRTLLPTVRR